MVFCGCLPDSLTLDPADVERKLSPRTAAICPVYVYGLPPEIDALLDVGARHGLPVYFDSAQGLGSEYRVRPRPSGRVRCSRRVPPRSSPLRKAA